MKFPVPWLLNSASGTHCSSTTGLIAQSSVMSSGYRKDVNSATWHGKLSAALLVVQLMRLTLGLHHSLHLC